MRLFRHIADAGEHAGMLLRHGITEDGDPAAQRPQQAEDESNRGSLAGAVRAQETVDRPRRHMKIEIFDLEDFSRSIMQALNVNGVTHVVFTPNSVSSARCSSWSDTPERRASARSFRTSTAACCERSRARRPGASSRTNVPAPWRISTNPWASRSRYAWVTVAGLTRKSAESWRTDGSDAAVP